MYTFITVKQQDQGFEGEVKVELEEEETIEVGEITGGEEAITEMTDIMIVDRHLLVDIMTEVNINFALI